MVVISSSWEALEKDLATSNSTVTVEAEFGDKLVMGSVATLAHHGKYSMNTCPCLENNWKVPPQKVGGSHFDLDFLGGTLAVMGLKPRVPSFWELAAYIDLNGAHMIGSSGASEADKEALYAFWAWSQKNRIYLPRDGSVLDITDKVLEAQGILLKILEGDQNLLDEGRKLKEKEKELNEQSFLEKKGDVCIRQHNNFVNHLYSTPSGEVCKACVSYNTERGEITVSLANPIEGMNCAEFMKEMFGPLAGGHAGIAGSPRGEKQSIEKLYLLAKELDIYLRSLWVLSTLTS